MEINDALIERLSTLAKLEFDATEKEGIKKDLTKILSFFEQISALDTEGVEPLIYLSDEQNVLRKDEVKQLITRSEALLNAPLADEQYIKVPKVIQK